MGTSKPSFTIKQVMTENPHTIAGHESVELAQAKMKEFKCRHLPVLEGGELVGIISDRDLDFALRVDHAEPSELKISEVYTAEPFVVAPNESLKRVCEEMRKGIGSAVIVERDKPIGIFTTTNACAVLADILDE